MTITMDLTPVRLSVGTLAHYDTLSALIPCKVVGLSQESGVWVAKILLTGTRGAYRRGEVLAGIRADRLPPRACLYLHYGQYHIRNTWHVWDGSARHEIFG